MDRKLHRRGPGPLHTNLADMRPRHREETRPVDMRTEKALWRVLNEEWPRGEQ